MRASGGDYGKLEVPVLCKIGGYYLAIANDAMWEQGLGLPSSLTYQGEVRVWVFM